jgi:hypothetical protein
MRRFLTFVFAGVVLSLAAQAADTGVAPRPASTDYPVQARADAATIAAAMLPSNQVSKMFSPEIARQYVVVEIAIYPGSGVPFDVESADFSLRLGERFVRADRAVDVAPWPEARRTPGRLPVSVTTETGVEYEHDNDPAYGRRQGVGTYTAVNVEAPGRPDPPPPPRVDPRITYDKIQRMALAEGDTRRAVAGYLYFPQYTKRKKTDAIQLKYSRDDVSVSLDLLKP